MGDYLQHVTFRVAETLIYVEVIYGRALVYLKEILISRDPEFCIPN